MLVFIVSDHSAAAAGSSITCRVIDCTPTPPASWPRYFTNAAKVTPFAARLVEKASVAFDQRTT
jgi:hypothetical protein